MVNPQALCNQHLLGEHGEIHKHKHNFEKGHRMTGRVQNNCLEASALQSRHDDLADERLSRGMNHKSPFVAPSIDYLPKWQREFKVDKDLNLRLLLDKCENCRERHSQGIAKGDNK